ncbi:MAG TPA: xanthine dehydrogenase family protein subunit M [Thermoanaerobaculia bacterium]|nr:xanthine dehydrogenase family protein subunit M [Thermoanaerobaculia bacterium]
MRGFEYARPASVEQAVRLLAAAPEQSRVLAGGSDLLSLMKDEVEAPARLVSLQAIGALRGLRVDPQAGLRIGALVTLAELAADAGARRLHPVLATAAGQAAGPQIRNVGTVVGNLCQRPRCWYYRNGFGLLAVRDGKPMVPEGDNRFHAILGNAGPAYFVHPSTVAPLLIVLGARLAVAGPKGERQLELAAFYRTPQGEGESEHALAPGEVVTEIVVPPPAAGRRVWSYEVRQRHTLDWSLATAAVALDMQGRRVGKARVVLGQVAPVPWEAAAAQQVLAGQELDGAVAARAGEAAVEGARALSRNRYKIQLARVAVKRAVLAAGGV